MVFKPVCCVCGQEIRPYHLFYMPTPGQHICIPCSEKEDPEEEEKENYHRIISNYTKCLTTVRLSVLKNRVSI